MALTKCLVKHVPKEYWDEVKRAAKAYEARGMDATAAELKAAEDMLAHFESEKARVQDEVVRSYKASPFYKEPEPPKETPRAAPKQGPEFRQYSIADRREAVEKAATIGEAVGVNILGKARRGLLKLQFLRDIREQFASLAGIRQHVDRIFEMSSSANDYIKAAGKIAKRWSSLNNDEMAKLDELAPMATVMEIHPDVPLDREMHLQASGREITNAHLADDAGNFPADVVAAHAELQRKWNTLQPHTKAVYKAARDSMAANWDKRQELLNKVVYRHFNGEIEKARAAKNDLMVKALERERDGFVKEYGRLLARVKGPYFPLMRFGDFFVVYKSEKYQGLEKQLVEASDKLKALYTKHQVPMEDIGAIDALNNALEEINLPQIAKMPPEARAEIKEARKAVAAARKEMESLQDKDEHYSNQAFESEAAARKEAERLGVEVRLKEDYLRELSGVNFAMINKIGQAIEASVGEKVASQAREAMMQVWLQSLPDKSALRRELKRKKIAGYSTDSMRAFSSYSQRDAHYLSRLEHMDDIVDSLMQLRRETRGKGLEREEVYNELARRYAASLKFSDTPVQDAITATAFIYQLGISPAFLLTNLSQPWMISMPLLAARHGLGRANAQLAKAFSEIGKAARASLKDQKTWFFEINTGNFSDGEQQMFSKALRQGLLDITLEYDLGAMARGGETKFNKATRMMSVLPHQVEVVNRMMTGLAAYRMEMQRSRGNQAQAEEYAMDILAKTHFDYSAANAPYVMKPGVVPFGKVLFQYRKYQLGVLTLFARQIGKALKGASAEERNEARAALLGLVTMHGALAGSLGLPFMGTALFAANVLQNVFGDDDEPWDSETALRNWLSDVLGVKLGAAAAKGLPMLAGLDVTNKVGAGSVLAPIRILRDNKEGRDLYLEFLAASVGPAMGGLMPRFWEGVSLMGDGNILKAGEMFTPKFVSDTVKAARVATEGIVTKAGNTAMKPEEADAWDVALQALGIPPSQITEVTAAMGAVEEAKRELNDRRAELKKAYVKARVEGAQDKLIEVQREIQAFNEKRRAKGEPVLKPADLIAAFKQREGYDKTRIAPGVRLPKNQAGLASYARFADTQ